MMGFDSDIGFNTRLKDIPIPTVWKNTEIVDEQVAYGAPLPYSDEEYTALCTHGFEMNLRTEFFCAAIKNFPYSYHELHVFKEQGEDVLPRFFMYANIGDSEHFEAQFKTFDALLFYINTFEKLNQLAEMSAE